MNDEINHSYETGFDITGSLLRHRPMENMLKSQRTGVALPKKGPSLNIYQLLLDMERGFASCPAQKAFPIVMCSVASGVWSCACGGSSPRKQDGSLDGKLQNKTSYKQELLNILWICSVKSHMLIIQQLGLINSCLLRPFHTSSSSSSALVFP